MDNKNLINSNNLNEEKQKAIQEILETDINSRKELMIIKREVAKKYKIGMLKNSEILAMTDKRYGKFIRILRKRTVRTMSGIAPVAILTKPYPCPGKCVYCPTEKGVPQSYLSNEPAVMRAIRSFYNPYKQIQDRLNALEINGHNPKKIELIVIGGTWSVLPKKYKLWYINECFLAVNNYNKNIKKNPSPSTVSELEKQIKKNQQKNEKADYKIIGITLETRPDYINEKELQEMRKLGCTRVELGVQAIDDKILKINKRGHGVEEVITATKMLKDYGFKVTYHIMPGLPGATAKKDLQMFQQLFSDQNFQPDQIKFYPTVVTEGSLLHTWWKQKKYKPYSPKVLQNLIIECKKIVPPYVRIIRLIRDIPGESILAGNKITNLRQIMQDQNVKCDCIRCRQANDSKYKIKDLKLKIQKYNASDGEEFFISYESNEYLYGFCRLRIVKDKFIKKAFVRELHVYGELIPEKIDQKKNQIQHTGIGKKLMQQALELSQENSCQKIIVISGVGVRNYYRKLGYKLSETYMVKLINKLNGNNN